MKKLLLIVSALILGLPLHGQTIENIFGKINNKVKGQYAPDAREKTYQVRLVAQEGRLILKGSTTDAAAKEAVLKRLAEAGITAEDQIKLLPDAALEGRTYGVVCMSVASFNSEPGFSEESGTQALAGMPVTILERSAGYWYRCVNMEGYTAWVITSSIAPMTKEEYDEYLSQPKVFVKATYSKIYSEPNLNSLCVSDLVLGDVLVNEDGGVSASYRDYLKRAYYSNMEAGYNGSLFVTSLKKASGWTRVSMADGRCGYVKNADIESLDRWLKRVEPAAQISDNQAEKVAQSIISSAKLFTGYPYVWGGTSVKGVDCSGLAKSAYFLNGYVLLRDASQQCKSGEAVDVEEFVNGNHTMEALRNLKVGDLLFFGRKATAERGERVTHVGIYMGGGKMIHSSNVVRINSLIPGTENYYSGSMLRARRIIGTVNQDKGVVSVGKIYKK